MTKVELFYTREQVGYCKPGVLFVLNPDHDLGTQTNRFALELRLAELVGCEVTFCHPKSIYGTDINEHKRNNR